MLPTFCQVRLSKDRGGSSVTMTMVTLVTDVQTPTAKMLVSDRR